MNTWQKIAADEYGFYANVNPAVDHPRWSQARERRIGELFKRPTLPFNGYADQVAGALLGDGPGQELLVTRLQFTTRVLKPAGFVAALGPLAWLLYAAFGGGDLGPDPVKTIQITTGLSTLVLLLAGLAVTPIRKYFHYGELIRVRRMLGLFAFCYALLHAVTYFVFDQSLDPGLIWADTVKHPRIAVGFIAFLLLLPLAVTSTDAMVRRLGKRWSRLHRLVYAATALSILHYLMVQKLDLSKGLGYVAVFTVLMLVRVPAWLRKAGGTVSTGERGTGERGTGERGTGEGSRKAG